MYEFIVVNNKFREQLVKFYDKAIIRYDIDKVVEKIVSYVKSLEDTNPGFYRYLIGLMFIDDYKILAYAENEDENIAETLELYNSLSSIDELLAILEENEDILCDMAMSPILFYSSDPIEQAEMLVLLSDEMIKEFNCFSLFEKCNAFKDLSMDDVDYIYKSNLIKEKDLDNDEVSIYEIVKTLLVLSVENFKNFKTITFKMLEIFYKWNKSKQLKNIELDDIREKLINFIEKESKENIIDFLCFEENVLGIVVRDFFHYQKDKSCIDKEETDKLYDTEVSEKIKIKLKEV